MLGVIPMPVAIISKTKLSTPMMIIVKTKPKASQNPIVKAYGSQKLLPFRGCTGIVESIVKNLDDIGITPHYHFFCR